MPIWLLLSPECPILRARLSGHPLHYRVLIPSRRHDVNPNLVLPGIRSHRRPAVEYVRDVYAELIAMGEGVRRPGDRSDISSDEEDEMEVLNRTTCWYGSDGAVPRTCSPK